jgi:hypothetical protein
MSRERSSVELNVAALLALALLGCAAQPAAPASAAASPNAAGGAPTLVPFQENLQPWLAGLGRHDAEATRAAREAMRSTLEWLAREPVFALGHQDTTSYGVGWNSDGTDEHDRSDGTCFGSKRISPRTEMAWTLPGSESTFVRRMSAAG